MSWDRRKNVYESPSVVIARNKKYGEFYRTRKMFPYTGGYPIWELEIPTSLVDLGVTAKVVREKINIRNKRGNLGDIAIIRVFIEPGGELNMRRVEKMKVYLKRRFPDFNCEGRTASWKR
jgi:hypothetical protein